MSDNQLTREDVKYIVVHASATKPGSNVTAADIDRMHRKRGWRKIGYHLYLQQAGLVETGRKFLEVGAHVEGHNFESFGVCLEGGVKDYETWEPENNYSAAQWSNLEAIIPVLEHAFPNAKVVGHRDFEDVNKACPCFDVGDWYAKTFG